MLGAGVRGSGGCTSAGCLFGRELRDQRKIDLSEISTEQPGFALNVRTIHPNEAHLASSGRKI